VGLFSDRLNSKSFGNGDRSLCGRRIRARDRAVFLVYAKHESRSTGASWFLEFVLKPSQNCAPSASKTCDGRTSEPACYDSLHLLNLPWKRRANILDPRAEVQVNCSDWSAIHKTLPGPRFFPGNGCTKGGLIGESQIGCDWVSRISPVVLLVKNHRYLTAGKISAG